MGNHALISVAVQSTAIKKRSIPHAIKGLSEVKKRTGIGELLQSGVFKSYIAEYIPRVSKLLIQHF